MTGQLNELSLLVMTDVIQKNDDRGFQVFTLQLQIFPKRRIISDPADEVRIVKVCNQNVMLIFFLITC